MKTVLAGILITAMLSISCNKHEKPSKEYRLSIVAQTTEFAKIKINGEDHIFRDEYETSIIYESGSVVKIDVYQPAEALCKLQYDVKEIVSGDIFVSFQATEFRKNLSIKMSFP